MTRELKFRAWDKENEKWVDTDGFHIHPSGAVCKWEWDTWKWEPTDKYVLTQYTGLKDKNGVEIYFGDILQTSSKDPETDMWEPDEWGYAICYENPDELGVCFKNWSPTNEEESVFNWRYVEVIGNRFENPELLDNK